MLVIYSHWIISTIGLEWYGLVQDALTDWRYHLGCLTWPLFSYFCVLGGWCQGRECDSTCGRKSFQSHLFWKDYIKNFISNRVVITVTPHMVSPGWLTKSNSRHQSYTTLHFSFQERHVTMTLTVPHTQQMAKISSVVRMYGGTDRRLREFVTGWHLYPNVSPLVISKLVHTVV